LEGPKRGDVFLELGLLLIVTGLMVGVLALSLVIVLARGSTIVSSSPQVFVSAAALSCLLAVVLVLVRRLKRLIASR
jgi:hypothetical protein